MIGVIWIIIIEVEMHTSKWRILHLYLFKLRRYALSRQIEENEIECADIGLLGVEGKNHLIFFQNISSAQLNRKCAQSLAFAIEFHTGGPDGPGTEKRNFMQISH